MLKEEEEFEGARQRQGGRADPLRPGHGAASLPIAQSALVASLEHGQAAFRVNVCENRFNRTSNLRRHRGQRPLECGTCPRRFCVTEDLLRHRRARVAERPFQCGACSKRFCRLAVLQVHQRYNSGERPYPCVHCAKRFPAASGLSLVPTAPSASTPPAS
ncbi:zinc finger and SCAN domain-containing protein 5B-like [Hypanus sabinus]|uniref:zinc finger and SCAN domain-containing protein 5B-like n=1 Tax=Hypanus sabinus TaxID=79690 RepID=UPI0028C49681|nr:zinc finger and SCAN domain-containing protein 5B-like [Hypanus sabinus]